MYAWLQPSSVRGAGCGINAGHGSCRVKFGAFLEHLESEHAGAFDRVASGHYASVTRDSGTGAATLRTTADAVKDQTYFLAHLSQVGSQRTLQMLCPRLAPGCAGTRMAA